MQNSQLKSKNESRVIGKQLIKWLLDSDVAIQYQVYRDLLDIERPDLQARISREGWGARFLSYRTNSGHWGRGFYQPKWTSSHYTLLDLKNLAISPNVKEIKETIAKIIHDHKERDGGINPAISTDKSDVCVNGMFLNYASYFETPQQELKTIVDFIISQQLPDGGFNCESNIRGAKHSSLHSTISLMEGINEYARNNYKYRVDALYKIEAEAREFMLQHKLYKSDKTGELIDPKMLMLSWPSRWRYDILRALDFFHYSGKKFDIRMDDALNVLLKKQRKDGTWPLQAKHPGQTHFNMEPDGQPSKWNTLRALRVLKHFDRIESIKPA
jgi:hypothetical protein